VNAPAQKMSAASDQPAFLPDPLDKLRVDDLYARYAACIADGALESWPDFFTEDCLYQIIPRGNFDRGLPVSIMLAESRGALVDRVAAIRHTMVFGPRVVLLSFSGIRITGSSDGMLDVRATFTVLHTQVDGVTRLLMAGRTFDRVNTGAEPWKFAARVAVYDTELLPATVIYPV
jgi:anthranilate 1,2-dioxygenase small subunit